ncbi:MAG: glycosyltransferase [Pseudanabaenaceae cyanobacterium bins.39]|nr:glycosyltransferase [Pseudanabaenaceae cyanobacterium bins.39]
MELAIILPCLNEIRHGYIEHILDNLTRQTGDLEIVAVVSECHDGTDALIASYSDRFPHIRLLRSNATNRAQRFNEGVMHSDSKYVLLHHPATLLPEGNILEIVRQTLGESHGWGALQHSFDLDHWLLRFTSWYSNYVRVQQKGIVYFDHCPFLRREIIEQAGYVPDLDIFEDTVFSDRLCRIAKPVLADRKVITSARRFQQRGIYRHAMLNQWLKVCYHLHIDPRSLNRLYEQKVSINVNYER